MTVTKQQLEQIKAMRSLLGKRSNMVVEDGTLELAKKGADEFTESTGITSMVIRKKNKYFWVSEYYFKTYKYTGKIFHTAKANLDKEINEEI